MRTANTQTSPITSLRLERAQSLILCLNDCPPEYALPILDEFLMQNATSGPVVSLSDIKADAEFWADIATNTELRVYMGAILKKIKGSSFGTASKKGLLVDIWESLPTADHEAFLSKVDPHGTFLRGVA